MSTFIFDTPDILASCKISSGTPFAPGISPPNLLHVSTSSGITVEAPCKTIGVFGIFSFTCFNISILNFASPLNLYAPWLVPIAIAKESHPVLSTNSFAWSGSVYLASASETFTSSSIPANCPNSASTTTPLSCA